MDTRTIFLIVAAVVVSGLTAEVLFGRSTHDWNGSSSKLASERVVLKLSAPRPAPAVSQPVEQPVEQPLEQPADTEAFTAPDAPEPPPVADGEQLTTH